MGGQEKVVQLLLEKRADINAEDEEDGTALRGAYILGHYAVIRLLRKYEAVQRRLLKNHVNTDITADHGKRPTNENVEEYSFLSENIEEKPSKKTRHR